MKRSPQGMMKNLRKLKKMENDAQTSKDLVAKEEEEPTSSESHETIKDEVVKTILEKAPLGEMHEEFKNDKMTPIPMAKECTI